ncbi:MAG: NAD(P)H-dependent oxidoreductase [Actinomycetaceae bacterium]|nr:NAD(P)H-dependent oxidoreductase [Arcanobacterium sp.]MDD7505629.1 NAD(P)H-dependent oxidoreductase [Actinomycetaceae bacterium]MDY6143407.1 CE1759 family FMN reductase [Arcanobacterium sp.]
MKIVVVSASLSENSSTDQLGERIALSARRELEESKARVEVIQVRLRDLAHAITDAMLTGFPNADLESAFNSVQNADAVVAVSPAYNASYSGLFKAFFDVLPEDTLAGMPMIIGATGGTPRHSLVTEHAMRPMFVYLHALVASTAVYAATEDWGAAAADSDGSAGSALQRRIDRSARELKNLVTMQAASRGVLVSSGAGIDLSHIESKGVKSDSEIAAQSSLEDMAPEEIYSDFKSFDELLKG